MDLTIAETLVPQAAIDLVKRFEGFEAEAYLCPAGVWTIGYGTTNGVRAGMTTTEEEAEAYLARDLISAALSVSRNITVPLSDNQRSALISFVYNLGAGAFQRSTLRQVINREGDADEVRAQLMRWVRAGGRVLRGLQLRREAEADLWETEERSPEALLPAPAGGDFQSRVNRITEFLKSIW